MSASFGLSTRDSGISIMPSNFRLLNPNHFCSFCPVKGQDREVEETVLMLFLKWVDPEDIVKFYLSGMCHSDTEEGVKSLAEEILAHAKAYGWEFFRQKNTKEMYMAMMGRALPHILKASDKMSVKDFTRVAKQYDVISGNEVAKQENNTVFDDRAVHTVLASIKGLLDSGKYPDVDGLLSIYEMELPGITEIWKRKHGAGTIITEQDVEDYLDGKDIDGEQD